MDDNITITSTMRDKLFEEDALSYMSYRVAMVIHKYGFPVLIPFGFTGNLLSLCVMLKSNNRRLSTCIYMSAISINDNIMLALGLWHFLFIGFMSPGGLYYRGLELPSRKKKIFNQFSYLVRTG